MLKKSSCTRLVCFNRLLRRFYILHVFKHLRVTIFFSNPFFYYLSIFLKYNILEHSLCAYISTGIRVFSPSPSITKRRCTADRCQAPGFCTTTGTWWLSAAWMRPSCCGTWLKIDRARQNRFTKILFKFLFDSSAHVIRN